MKKGHVVGGALVVLAIVAALFLLSRDRTGSAPSHPDAAAPARSEEPAAPEPPPPGPPAPEEPTAASAPAETVEVVTNVPGAKVTVSFVTAGGAPELTPVEGAADANGRAVLAVPEHEAPLRRADATVRAEGWIPASERVVDGKARIELKPGVRITGRVVDEAGEPVPDARVWCSEGSSMATAVGGAFEVYAARAGDVSLTVRHARFRTAETAASAPAEGLVIPLDPGWSVSGRVAFPDGRPVPGAWVQSAGSDFARAESDRDGRYLLSGLPGGEVKVSCLAARESRTVVAGASDVDFTVDQHLVRISLVDHVGRPFRGADVKAKATKDGVEVMSMAADVGAEGVLRCQAPSGSILLVSPSAPGCAERVTRVELNDDPRVHDVRVVMEPRSRTGRVALRVSRDTGRVPEKVFVRVTNEAGSVVSDFYSRELSLDSEGRAEFGVPAGSLTIAVRTAKEFTPPGEDHGLEASRAIVVEAGRTVPVEFVIPTGGRLSVTVHAASGALVAPEGLSLLSEAGERLRVAFWGRWRDGWMVPPSQPGPAHLNDALPPGNYTLVLTRDGKEAARREIAIERGRTLTVDLRLEK